MARASGLLVVFLLPLLVGLPTIGGSLIQWPEPAAAGGLIRDDILYIVHNPHVTEPVPPGLIFRTPFQPDRELGLYRPLTTLSFRADFVLSEATETGITLEAAFYPHLTNLLLAGGAAVLLTLLAGRTGLAAIPSLAAGALFAVHPARSEATFWISGRAENLMTVFSIGALLVAAKGAGGWRGPATAALAVLAFLSKEQGAVLMLLVILIPGLPLRDRLRHLAWTGGALAAAFVWRAHVLGVIGPEGAQQVLQGTTLIDRGLLGAAALGDYIRLCVWPHPLLNEYDDPTGLPSPWRLVPAVAFLALLGWLVFTRRWRQVFWATLFLAPLIPVLNILHVTGESFAERFLALPLAGVALAAGSAADLHSPATRWSLAVLLLGCALLCGRRAFEYADEDHLMEALVRDAPEQGSSYRLVSGLSRRERVFALGRGDQLTALKHGAQMRRLLQQGLAKNPDLPIVRLELAKLLIELGAPRTQGGSHDLPSVQEAEFHARYVIERVPSLYEAHATLGAALAAQGKWDDAMAAFREALRLEPRHTVAGGSLIQLLEKAGRTAEAQEVMSELDQELVRVCQDRWWDPQAFITRSQLAHRRHLGEEAVALLRQALALAQVAPLKYDIATRLHQLLQGQGRTSEAASALDATIRELERRSDTWCVKSDLFTSLAQLESLRNAPDRARYWYSRAESAARRPDIKAGIKRMLDSVR